MEVLSVTLKNFKAHRDRNYSFSPGTNAICGANGAGKTSILEAIAWVLFDHCDYAKSELITVGAKSAQVTVTVISNQDGRVYELRRSTSKGYSIHDPQLNLNLGLKKIDDVRLWLCEHLGVPPTTELSKLFAETIGIPQGSFTTDFLRRPADRKKVFDPILKVEDYKLAYTKTRDLEVYAQGQVTDLERTIAAYEQQLTDWEDLKQTTAELTHSIQTDRAKIAALQTEIEAQRQQMEALSAIATQLQALQAQLQALHTQQVTQQETLKLLEQSWASAQQAVALCRQHRPNFNAYEQAQADLKQLNQHRQTQQQYLQQRETLQQQLRDRDVEQSQLQGRLASFAQMHQALAQWQQQVPQQDHLEQAQAELREQLQSLEALQQQTQTLQGQRQQRQAQLHSLTTEIAALVALAPQVEQLPQLEAQRQELQSHLSRVQAAQQFAAELEHWQQTLTPDRERYRQQVQTTLSQLQTLKLAPKIQTQLHATLEAGVTLTDRFAQAVDQLLADLTDPAAITQLQHQLQDLKSRITAAQQAQAQQATLAPKQAQQATLQQELDDLQQMCDRNQAQLAQLPHLTATFTQLGQDLAQLQDPKGQVRVLEQQLQQEAQLQTQLAQLNESCAGVRAQLATFEEHLQAFANLEDQVAQQQQILNQNQEVYQIYLRHRNEANSFKQLDPQRQAAIADLKTLTAQIADLQAQYEQQIAQQDPSQLQQVTAAYQTLQSQRDQLQGGLPPKLNQLQYLEQQLQQRQAIAEQREGAIATLAPKQNILNFVSTARRIYNQSGPRITQLYLTEISAEADRLFRELLNRSDVVLEWTADYEIRVQEQGHWRSFKSLSGGEQMCAALAVRLALLKILADINIAFFDEPTTNMDLVRRQQLAEALNHLKSFRQLFVISHDDTFESITENVIRVQ